MGFLLFTESAVFNPINYGLQAGDNIFVVAVGGGGGAGGVRYNTNSPYNYKKPATGGAGAASSFGEYVSAPGGSGGSGGIIQTQYNTLAGGYFGQSGWFPWLESHPISPDSPRISAWVPQQFLDQALAHITMGLGGFRYINVNSDYNVHALPQAYISQQTTSGITSSSVTRVTNDYNEVPWATFDVNMANSHTPTISSRTLAKGIPAAGTGRCYYGTTLGVTYGSIGYGVAGTSHVIDLGNSTFAYSSVGSTGSIVKKMITLADVSPIAVSVGGGGGSAGFENTSETSISSATAGKNGSTSAQAPSNGKPYSGAGGYAGVNPQDQSGGGVCGCVAIWF